MKTATQLFAGVEPVGDETCFYCGGQCDQSHKAGDVVKSSFTSLDTVCRTGFVCGGCIQAMSEGIDIVLIDGEIKVNQKTRTYTWIVTSEGRTACSKAHRVAILDACLHPPQAPFVICITDAGQRHLLYRAVVNMQSGSVTVTLEGERVTYKPSELEERLVLCRKVCAATGKPAMKDEMSVQTQMRVVEHFDDERVLAAWLDCFNEPLTRLAVWLCPAKEECIDEFPGTARKDPEPEHRATQATFSWVD